MSYYFEVLYKLVHHLFSVLAPTINCPFPVYELFLPDSDLIPNLEGMFSLIVNLFQACFLFLVQLAHDTGGFSELLVQLLFYMGLESIYIHLGVLQNHY